MFTNYLIFKFIGPYALLYLFLSGLFGMGLHPCAGHTIAEHYEFVKGLETYNYFGPLNLINFNLGYHTEHHDFHTIPWNRLPELRKIAPEFYEGLPYHTSYVKVLFNFIFDKDIGPHSRI
jgi:sphingolipid 4-desaturase/C4-monooxygenase